MGDGGGGSTVTGLIAMMIITAYNWIADGHSMENISSVLDKVAKLRQSGPVVIIAREGHRRNRSGKCEWLERKLMISTEMS